MPEIGQNVPDWALEILSRPYLRNYWAELKNYWAKNYWAVDVHMHWIGHVDDALNSVPEIGQNAPNHILLIM